MVFFDAETGDDSALVCCIMLYLEASDLASDLDPGCGRTRRSAAYAQIYLRTRPYIETRGQVGFVQ